MKAKDNGRLFQIAYLGYGDPPDGAPRVLCEMYVEKWAGGQRPKAIEQFPVSLGGGYSFCSQALAKPGKQLSPETLAVIRKKRITRRVTAKVPMFAEHFIQEAIDRKPDYYSGITDAGLQEAVDAQAAREWARYYELTARAGELIVYAQEPEACKQKAARLKVEMDAVKEKAKSPK